MFIGFLRFWKVRGAPKISKKLNCEYIINLQGDEPFINPKDIVNLNNNIISKNSDIGTIGNKITKADFIDESIVKYEPHSAIFVEGNDNLIFYKKIIQYSKDALKSDGVLYLECHTDRINFVKNILKINNFKNIKIKEDLFGRKRMIKACI